MLVLVNVLVLVLVLTPSCTTGGSSSDASADASVTAGTIAYPFVDESPRLGAPGEDAGDRFVIRSAVGDREYAVEIPGAARDYDVQVPLADLGEADADVLSGKRPKSLGSPVATDREVVAALPRLDRDRAGDTALMDGAFGVGSAEGPRQAPSYTLGIAKINELYKRRQLEFALVEINNLAVFYPNSPQLLKMKGTVLLKMRNYELAEAAWTRAAELAPKDRALRAALERLKRRIAASAPAAPAPAAPAKEGAPAH